MWELIGYGLAVLGFVFIFFITIGVACETAIYIGERMRDKRGRTDDQ